MIPTLGQDLKTLLGRIGGWPGDFGPETACALYNTACRFLPVGGTVVDLTPSGGKSSILLSAAAFKTGAKIISFIDRRTIQPVEELWFNRAMKMFKMKEVCTPVDKIENMMVDMITIRGNEQTAKAVYAEGLKPGGLLFGINLPQLDGIAPEAGGNGWAVWRKPEATKIEEPKSTPIELPQLDPTIITEAEVAEIKKEAM